MTPTRALVLFLRANGAILLLALPPVFFPLEWMQAIHRFLGMGELPELPIISYLARSLSALYAFFGLLAVYVSFDTKRYLPVIRLQAGAGVVFGAGMILMESAIGMPPAWTYSEGPIVLIVCGVMLWLTRQVERAS